MNNHSFPFPTIPYNISNSLKSDSIGINSYNTTPKTPFAYKEAIFNPTLYIFLIYLLIN